MNLISQAAERSRGQASAMLANFKAEMSLVDGGGGGALGGGGVAVGQNQGFLDSYRSAGKSKSQYGSFDGWVFSSIRPIAQTIAGQPFMLAREARGSKSKDVTFGRVRRDARRKDYLAVPEVGAYSLPSFVRQGMKRPAEGLELFESHPLLDVLRNPNPLMTTWQFLYVISCSMELTGWSHLWLTFVDGKRVIWPLPTGWVSPIHRDGVPFAFWAIKPGGDGEPIEVPGDEVVPLHYSDPSDLLGAVSPLSSQQRAVVTDQSIQEAQQKLMENSIWPRYAIFAGNVEDPDGNDAGPPLLEHWQRDEMFSLIKQLYGSSMNYGEPIILDALIKDIKKIDRNPAEMDFRDGGEITKKRISLGFGTPGFVMGETEPSSRAASAVSRQHFADFTVNPKIELISQILSAFVAPRLAKGGEKLFLWIDPYEPEDREQTRLDVETAILGKAINRDEIRETLRGLSHLPPLVNGQNQYVGMAEELVEAEAVDGTVSKSAEAQGKAITYRKSGEEYGEAAKGLWIKTQAKAELHFAEVVRKLFVRQRESIVEALSLSYPSIDGIFVPEDWYEEWETAITPEGTRLAIIGAVDELMLFESAKATPDPYIELPPEIAPAVQSEVNAAMGQPYWHDIHATTQHEIGATLQEGIANGESLYDLTVRLEDDGLGALGNEHITVRSTRIARTESTGFLNSGHQATQDRLFEQGQITKKQWLTIIDNDTRGSHITLNNAKVAVNKNFQVGNSSAPYPGHHGLPPGERINCILPGTQVQGSFIAATKALYEGKVTEIVTRSGRRLSVTPNHRVLTSRGLIAAGSVQEGDQFLAYNGHADQSSMPGGNYVDGEPARIEDVFQTIFSSVAASRMIEVGRAEVDHFHGDGVGIKGDIEIVGPERVLLERGESRRSKQDGEVAFALEDFPLPQVVSDGSPASPFERVGVSSPCRPCGGALVLDRRPVSLEDLPLQQFGFGPASNLDVVLSEAAKQERPAVARFTRQLLEGHPGEVSLDEVVEVRNFYTSTHVYDLQSLSGLIIAENLFISNCRCTSVIVVKSG